MARTKQTAKKVGPGPKLAEQAATAEHSSKLPDKPSKFASKPLGKKMMSELKSKTKVKRRVHYQIKSLREIRKAQKATNLCIPRASFIRVVRDISDRLCNIMRSDVFEVVRWQFSALGCIQEAAEDFLIDFFNDSYIAAAFAHRVTLMSRDFVLVSRLRYRFDKFLEPIPLADRKAFDILNIPAAFKPKQNVKIEDVTHLYKTRKADEMQQEIEREHEQEQVTEDHMLTREVERLSVMNLAKLAVVTGQIIVNVSPIEGEDYFLQISPDDKSMLEDRNLELSDSVVYIGIRYVFVLNPLFLIFLTLSLVLSILSLIFLMIFNTCM